jgi:hypothetical protein
MAAGAINKKYYAARATDISSSYPKVKGGEG